MTTGTPYPSAPPPPPPLYPPPGAYAPLRGRLTALKVVFGLMIAVSAVAALSDLLEILLLDRLIAGENVSDSELDNNDIRQGVAGLAQFGAWIACVVIFIMWMFRAYKNVDAVARGARRYDHGWAIGAWFVPILNLFRPKQIINDIWRAGGNQPEPPALLAVWWVMWLITNWIANFGLRNAFDGDTPEELREGTIAYLVSDTLDIPTAILAILVATTLTRRLEARAAEDPPPPQAPPSVPPPLSGR
jgi:hypothetical protein